MAFFQCNKCKDLSDCIIYFVSQSKVWKRFTRAVQSRRFWISRIWGAALSMVDANNLSRRVTQSLVHGIFKFMIVRTVQYCSLIVGDIQRGSPPRTPIFFLSAKSTGDIKFLVLSDPLNTILQKKWVVTGILSWELRFEIAWISFHCFVCKMIGKLIFAPPSVYFMINRFMYFII